MALKSLDVNKKFNIYSSFTLSNDDIAVLSLLYTPLMNQDALMLYLSFNSLLERNNLKSEELSYQAFFDIYSITKQAFNKAKVKLEGIGLLQSFTSENNDIYMLVPPMTARNFIKDTTLGIYLYSKMNKETFDYIYNHFKIEKLDKSKYQNVTKSFDEVYQSNLTDDITYEKFKYILGKKPNNNIIIKNYKFDFEYFKKQINQDFLDMGVTKQFESQISKLSFVYGFDEEEMISLYGDSINKSGLYDYRLMKKNANNLFIYKRNINAPKLHVKEENETPELEKYLENTSADKLLESVIPNYPEKYLNTVLEIYSNIELPRGVLNCMILKILKDKNGELPSFAYFKKVSLSWIKDSVLTTSDAIKYVTTLKKDTTTNVAIKEDDNDNGGFTEL